MTADRTAFKPRNRKNSHTPKKRSSRSFWIETLVDFSKSGLSVQEFCRLKNLAPSNFYAWRKRLREGETNTPSAPATFIPLEVMPINDSLTSLKEIEPNQQASSAEESQGCDSGLVIHLNDSIKIFIDRDFHGPTLQRLVQICSPTGPETC